MSPMVEVIKDVGYRPPTGAGRSTNAGVAGEQADKRIEMTMRIVMTLNKRVFIQVSFLNVRGFE